MFKKFLEERSSLRNSIFALSLTVFAVGVVNVAFAVYTPPTCPPPGCNTEPPLDVSGILQIKAGPLGVVDSTWFSYFDTAISTIGDQGFLSNQPGGKMQLFGNLGVWGNSSSTNQFMDISTRGKTGAINVFNGLSSQGDLHLLQKTSTVDGGNLFIKSGSQSGAVNIGIGGNVPLNVWGDTTIGTSTGVGGSRQLNVFGDLNVNQIPDATSPTGWVYHRIGRTVSNDPISGATPAYSWWQTAFPGKFSGRTYDQVRITAARGSGVCEDTTLTDYECENFVDITAPAPTPAENLGHLAYDLYAYRPNNSTNEWVIAYATYAKRWTGRLGGSLTAESIQASNGDFFGVDTYKIESDYLYGQRAFLGTLDVRNNITANQFCVMNGPCITTSTVLGTWLNSTSSVGSIYYDRGSVGIGTGSNPGAQLHVKGSSSTVSAMIENGLSGGSAVLTLSRERSPGLTDDQWSLSATGGGSNKGLFVKNDLSATTSLALLRDGRVGIGTQSPLGILDVVGGGDIRLKPNSTGGRVTIGENGLVNTVISGNLSVESRFGTNLQYTATAREQDGNQNIGPNAHPQASQWSDKYKNNTLGCESDPVREDQTCLSGAPFSTNTSTPKYDLYIITVNQGVPDCGLPPNGNSATDANGNPLCEFYRGARVYTAARTSGGDISARKLTLDEGAVIGKKGFDPFNVTAPTNGLLISGRVGINNPNPNSSYQLDVNGKINADAALCIADDCKFSWPSDGIWGTSTLGAFYNGGNISIGTTTVLGSTKLQIVGNETSFGVNRAGITLQDSSAGSKWGLINFGTGSGPDSGKFGISLLGAVSPIKLMIDSDGDVGIGTTSPLDKLHVAGNETGPGVGRARIRFEDTGVGQSWTFNAFGNGSVEGAGKFGINDASVALNRFIIDTNGNIGIGTTAPVAKLQVNGNTVINGRLGVGNTNPQNPLDVTGDARISHHVLAEAYCDVTNNNCMFGPHFITPVVIVPLANCDRGNITASLPASIPSEANAVILEARAYLSQGNVSMKSGEQTLLESSAVGSGDNIGAFNQGIYPKTGNAISLSLTRTAGESSPNASCSVSAVGYL